MATETTDVDAPREDGFVPFLGQSFPESLTLGALLALLALVVTAPYLPVVKQVELFATGFFRLFTLQMSLILLWVLSAGVVESERAGRFFDWVAAHLPTDSQTKVIYATGFVALLFGWINWALGLVGGLFIGHKLCQRAEEQGVRVHYPLVLTAGLLSLVITTVGLSSPGALMMTDATGTTNFLVNPEQGELVVNLVAFLSHPVVVVSSVLFLFTLPALLVLLAPDEEHDRESVVEFSSLLEGGISETLDHYSPPPREEWVFADKLEQSQIISAGTFLFGAISLGAYLVGGGQLTLLWFLFGLMMFGIFTQKQPVAYVEKTKNATKWVHHLAIPFLMYAGVYALLTEAGLYASIGDALVATGIPEVASYVVALALGVFVPSAGSVWVIQGPALTTTGVDLVSSLVSVMYGAGVSNIWLGFLFAGTLTTIYGFDWREYLRYAAAITAYVSAVVIGLLLVF